MTAETMGELAEHRHIIGVKDATGDLARVPQQRLSCGKDFIQLSGEDATALGFNAHGGVGCISVTANMAPALCSQMQKATLEGVTTSAAVAPAFFAALTSRTVSAVLLDPAPAIIGMRPAA